MLGVQKYYVPPVQKLGGHVPPHKLGPWFQLPTNY